MQKARSLTGISGNDMLAAHPERNRRQQKLSKPMVGQMIMYFYDPKWKEELPYYDRFPLVIPIRLDSDRFLGLNLHYLPPKLRAILFDAILDIQQRNRNASVKISYADLKAFEKNRYFKPCVKEYLYSHLRSRVQVVPESEWDIVMMMPLERFEKKTKTQVWAESAKKFR